MHVFVHASKNFVFLFVLMRWEMQKTFHSRKFFNYLTTRNRREGTKRDKKYCLIDYDEMIIDLIKLFAGHYACNAWKEGNNVESIE